MFAYSFFFRKFALAPEMGQTVWLCLFSACLGDACVLSASIIDNKTPITTKQ